MEGDVLVKGQHETTRLVVPTALRYRLFLMTHAGPTAAHLGPLRITPSVLLLAWNEERRRKLVQAV